MVLNLSWFVAPFQRLSTLVAPCSSIKIPKFVLGFVISRQSYLVKTSARGLRRTASWPQGGRGPRLRNPGLDWVKTAKLISNTTLWKQQNNYKLTIKRNPFAAKNQTPWSYPSKYFACRGGNFSSYWIRTKQQTNLKTHVKKIRNLQLVV